MKKNIWLRGFLILATLTMIVTLSACGSGTTATATDGATLTGSAQ